VALGCIEGGAVGRRPASWAPLLSVLGGAVGRRPASSAPLLRPDARRRAPVEGETLLLDGLGTLVALEPPWPALVAQLREAHDIELSVAVAERAFRAEMAYYRAHHYEGRDRGALEDLRARCAQVLRAQLPTEVARALSIAQLTAAMLGALRFSSYPDAPTTLGALRARGVTLVVASNWDVSLPAVLRDVGLEGMVDGVVTSAEIGRPKPERAIFDAALALAGSSPQRTLHVGDSIEHDVRGALAAGIRPVLLYRAEAEPEEEPPPGVPTISSLAELLT
jgi:putative hydrolase of the HAD superfamily